MYNKTLMGTREYEVETESLLVLAYYLIEKQINPSERYYGIQINSNKIIDGLKEDPKCKRLLLSESKEWTQHLLDTFIGNGVTPGTMEYIIDDILEIPC